MTDSTAPLAAQTALVTALARMLGAGGQPAQCFDTHISWVLVAGGYAYKIKKAVKLDFLDCSTLAARRRLCEEELRLNRRLSPTLYVDVVAVTGDAAQPRLGDDGKGEAIEYAVRMHAFAQTALWSRRLDEGSLSVQEVDALADLLGRFHQQAAAASAGTAWGRPESLAATAAATFDAIARLAPDQASQATLARLRAWDAAEHRRLAPEFAARKDAGMVRECHGDLHLGNIVTTGGGVGVFDCIEFSEPLRWIDVINDLAFAYMDLACRQRRDLATRLLNGYLAQTGDYAGLVLLAYYSMHRALVRCLVMLLRAAQAVSEVARDAARREALAYLAHAARLTGAPKPAVLITHGCSGSGKTTFSREAAALLGAVHLRSDIERKRLHGLQPLDRSGAAHASPLYDADATRRTYERLLALTRAVAAAGMVALVDAAFLDAAQRRPFARYAARAKLPFRIFDLRASPAVMMQRLALRANAGADASDADAAVLARQLAHARPLSDAEMAHAIAVDADRLSPGDVAGLCMALAHALGIDCQPSPDTQNGHKAQEAHGGGFAGQIDASQGHARGSS